MMKKKSSTNVHRFIGAAAVLLLITAALFVGAAAADPIDTGEKLASAVEEWSDNNTIVNITVSTGFKVEAKDLKRILVAVGENAFSFGNTSKTLTVDITDVTEENPLRVVPASEKPNQMITLSGTGRIVVNYSATSDKVVSFTANGLNVTAYYNEKEYVKVDNAETVTITLTAAEPDEFGPVKKAKAKAGKCTVTINTGSATPLVYDVISATIDEQEIRFSPTKTPYYAITAETKDGKSLTGIVNLKGDSSISFKKAYGGIYAGYASDKLNASGNLEADVIYMHDGTEEKVHLSEVNGNYGNGEDTSLSGTVTLLSNLTITHVLPVPSFVTDAKLYLNEKWTLSTTKDKYFDYKKSEFRVMVQDTGKIKALTGLEFKDQFGKASDYKSKPLQQKTEGGNWVLYIVTGGGGGGGGGGGSSTIPTYTPGVTPTPTQTWTPIDPSQTGVQPSQSPKSPMPVFGILAGLGAAALAGVVLRRK